MTRYAEAILAFVHLRGIFVTHLHADHVINFYDFVALPGFGVNDSFDGIVAQERAEGLQRPGLCRRRPDVAAVAHPRSPAHR